MKAFQQQSSRRRGTRLAVIVASTALLAAACGSDDDDSADSTPASAAVTTAAPAATTATTAAPAGTTAPADSAAPATGDPVRVSVILDESDAMGLTYTSKRAAMDAMADEINAHGGLGGSGRPVELAYCVTQFDPNLAQQCARDAVADESVIAVVGMITNYPDQVNPILEEAGMASVGTEPYGAGDGTSPIAFPIIAGYLSSTAGMGTILADVGQAKSISVIHVDVPSALASVEIVRTALESRGLELKNVIPVPIGKADVSAETAAALEGSDGIALLTDPATANKVIEAMVQQGDIVPVGGAGGQFSRKDLAALGDAGEGLLLASWFATDDVDEPGVAEFLRVMDEYASTDLSDDLAKSGYTAMLLLNTAAAEAATLDRAGLLAELTGMTEFDTGGLTPPIDFTAEGPLELDGTALPWFSNPTVMYGKVTDGKVAAIDGTFVSPFEAPQS